MLTIALPKGRLRGPILQRLGDLAPAEDGSRKLSVDGPGGTFLTLKGGDVAVYVERGAADLGFVGSDVLTEWPADVLSPLDLGIGRCTLALASRPDVDLRRMNARGTLRVATKYPQTTTSWLARQGWVADVVPLSGSIEVAVLAGLADAIVDLVQTGRTLADNGLVVREQLADVSCRVVVNRAAWRLKRPEVRAMLDALEVSDAAA